MVMILMRSVWRRSNGTKLAERDSSSSTTARVFSGSIVISMFQNQSIISHVRPFH